MRLFLIISLMGWLSFTVVEAADPPPIPDALANELPPVSEGEQFLQERDKEKADSQVGTSRFNIKKETVKQTKKDDVCIDIHSVIIKGVTLLNLQLVDQVRSGYEGKCLGKNTINHLLKTLNNLYIERGYITSRAYLPKQKIKSGKLIVQVVEGTVETIEINPDFNNTSKVAPVFTVQPGDKLNLRELENGLDQINRVKSAKAKLQLWPGKAVGTSKVKLTNKPKDEVRGYVTADNQGSASTGDSRIKWGLEYDNLLALNDAWSFYYIGSENTNALAFEVNAPYKDWDFSYSWSNSEYLSPIVDNAELYGRSNTHTLKANKKLRRDKHSKTELNLSMVARDPKRFINDIELNSARSSSARVGITHTRNIDRTRTQYKLGITRGLDLWGDNQSAQPNHNFFKIDAGTTYSTGVNKNWRFDGEYKFQYGNNPLWSSEQVNLGGLSTIRGFVGTPITGDTGLFARNKFTFLPDCKTASSLQSICKRAQPYAFFDVGVAHADQKNRYGEKWGYLSGGGVGLKYSGKVLTVDMTVSQGILASAHEIEKGAQFYVSGTFKLF